MWTGYANEISEEDLLYEPSERPTDIQLPPVVNILLLCGWLVICLIGFAIIFFANNIFLGIAVIGVPTFLGMVIKPTFALCLMMLVLPTGTGIGITGIFSLDRGIGLALAVSFLLNLMVSRPSLHIHNKALWVLVIYTIWVFFSTLAAPHVSWEVWHSFTQFQLLVLVFIVYWILQTNGEKAFRWALRSYVVGTLGMIIIAYKSGAQMVSVEEGERYSATAGGTIDSNMLSVLLSMAFLAAIYLLVRDKRILWRIIYLIAIVILPFMVLRTGSRGGLVALVFTMLSPLLFIRQVLRKPALAAIVLVVILLASVSVSLLVKKKGLEKQSASRLTDIQAAKVSLTSRFSYIRKGIEAAIKYPMGTGYYSWIERTGETHVPHNDFFFALGVHGIPAAVLFMTFVIMMMFTIKRMPLGLEKLYARAILTFLLVMGLDMGQLWQKHFWVFLTIIMSIEKISMLKSDASESIDGGIDEEDAGISY